MFYSLIPVQGEPHCFQALISDTSASPQALLPGHLVWRHTDSMLPTCGAFCSDSFRGLATLPLHNAPNKKILVPFSRALFCLISSVHFPLFTAFNLSYEVPTYNLILISCHPQMSDPCQPVSLPYQSLSYSILTT